MAFNEYAQYYDLFYKRKGYKKECDFLESLFAQYYKGTPKTILDLGCGTANHMIPLLERGYKVAGVDASSQMLALARDKTERFGAMANLTRSRIQSFDLDRRFDVVLSMFSVIDYVLTDKEIVKTFKNVAKHMYARSIFIFDFWQASAVNDYYSSKKEKVFHYQNKTLERRSETKIFPDRSICEVMYNCVVKQNKCVITKFKEKHTLRYFSVEQMVDLLKKSGLKVLGICPFLNKTGRIRKNTWDITIIAQKI